MRVSTNQFYTINSNHISRLQQETNGTITQLATGKRINTTADDAIGSIVLSNLDQQDNRTSQYRANINLAHNRLAQQEGRLGEYETLLMNLRDKMLQGNDGALPAESRAAIALDLEQGLAAVLTLANSQDENGNYVFAGHRGETKPFSQDSNGAVGYLGDDGRREARVADGVTVPVSESGQRIFMEPANGSGDYRADYRSATMTGKFFVESANITNAGAHVSGDMTVNFGADADGNRTISVSDAAGTVLHQGAFDPKTPLQVNGIELTISGEPAAGDSVTLSPQASADIFASLNNAIALLRDPAGLDSHQQQALYGQALDDLNASQLQASIVRAETGNYMASLDNFNAQHNSMELVNAGAKSTIRDLDYAAAVSDLEQQNLALGAVTKSFAKVEGLTLFDYI
ncbi:flagellar hook-associated protein FlgL [Ferrimonas senticii]|uniref:flagellar hook-associated protein FlgL n=1 Tax=Ferrimonas senticii TaxID=394566 RepID=UPI00040F7859|nr:flagellar hook-associated protein FlgL [Ferrimonas senticii]